MKRETYRGAIYRGIGSVDVVDLPYPECGDEDVIVRNLMTGVCGSDVAAYRHGGDDYMIWRDHEFGHEAVSEVVEMGRNIKGLELGDHVSPNRLRQYGIGAQILNALGLHELILLTNSPNPKPVGLEGYGLTIVGTRPILPREG